MEPLTIISFALSLVALAASIMAYRAVSRIAQDQDN